jgi:hypothetical protein
LLTITKRCCSQKNNNERSKKKWKVICSSEDFYMINICLDHILYIFIKVRFCKYLLVFLFW